MTESGSWNWANAREDVSADIDVTVASPARIWNYWVGGKDHFEADREAAEKVLEVIPAMPLIARTSRQFLRGAVHRLAADYGIRQFLDIGTGLPVADSTHEVAQRAAPRARVVYADNDPVVLTHARALLSSGPEGKTDYIDADLRDTAKILDAAARTLDFSQPVAVMLIEVLHFIPDADDPFGIVGRLMSAVSSGGYLVIAHAPSDTQADTMTAMTERYNQLSSVRIHPRTRQQVAGFFDGLDLMEPGVVPIDEWPAPRAAHTGGVHGLAGYCGIGLKR